jgi:hypothetical protein
MPKPSLPLIPRTLQHLHGVCTAPEKWLYGSGLLSAARLTLPHFLGIGAQRSATTWLFQNLRRHPDLYLPERKELHYFDWDFHRTVHSYAARFVEGRGKVCGDITPAYAALPPERIRFIRQLMPDLRLLFILRNPIDRAWSAAMLALVWRPGRPYEEVTPEEFYAHFRSANARARGDYLATIDRWLAEYPEERLFLGYLEDVATRPEWLFTQVLTFLGVRAELDPSAFPLREKSNQHWSVPLPPEYRSYLEELYAEEIEALYRRLGEPVRGWRVGSRENAGATASGT